MFAAALVAASTLGAALAPSGASAAVAPGPNAIPSADLVRSVDPTVTGIEQAGYRRHWDDDFDSTLSSGAAILTMTSTSTRGSDGRMS
jgi:hypothetical protein